jgi:murein DD-endopeptidase MepM/ murein hydrolase activator NlpD
MKKYYKIIIASIFSLLLLSLFVFTNNQAAEINDYQEPVISIKEEITNDKIELLEISAGTSFSALLQDHGFSLSDVNAIYNSALSLYDFKDISAGNFIKLIYIANSDELKALSYQINSNQEIVLNLNNDHWTAKLIDIDYDIEIKHLKEEINNSLYQSALEANMDLKSIINLANAFQWTIDFSIDCQKGDIFEVIYEKKYLDGEFKDSGKILAARYINQENEFQIYYFQENEDNKGYFDENANSVQKMFLKAPVEFKYISSGFTTGLRYIEAFNVSTGHRAIDYAAPIGTPIRAVGDGLITYVGWNGSYGNFISLRHNGTYITNYAHLSRFAVKNGQRVKQGDIIGYVGSTGFSTGPHLHYEMVKNGIKINPLTEILPPGEAIKEENLERFYQEIAPWQEMFYEKQESSK